MSAVARELRRGPAVTPLSALRTSEDLAVRERAHAAARELATIPEWMVTVAERLARRELELALMTFDHPRGSRCAKHAPRLVRAIAQLEHARAAARDAYQVA